MGEYDLNHVSDEWWAGSPSGVYIFHRGHGRSQARTRSRRLLGPGCEWTAGGIGRILESLLFVRNVESSLQLCLDGLEFGWRGAVAEALIQYLSEK